MDAEAIESQQIDARVDFKMHQTQVEAYGGEDGLKVRGETRGEERKSSIFVGQFARENSFQQLGAKEVRNGFALNTVP